MTRKGVFGVCAVALLIAPPAFATGARPPERFASTQATEPIAHSRSDAAQLAAQIPGAAAVLLEALRKCEKPQIPDFDRAILLDPRDAFAYNNRGLAYRGRWRSPLCCRRS
jgi:hypothetical protein